MGPSGGGIDFDQLPGVEIGEVFAVGRPGELIGRASKGRAMSKDFLDGEGLLPILGWGSAGSQQEDGKNRQQNQGSLQRQLLLTGGPASKQTAKGKLAQV